MSARCSRPSPISARLCKADQAIINRVEGEEVVRVASLLDDQEAPTPIGTRRPLDRASLRMACAIVEQRGPFT